eukprot:1180596-Prorocentrum_minimum.AAC.1
MHLGLGWINGLPGPPPGSRRTPPRVAGCHRSRPGYFGLPTPPWTCSRVARSGPRPCPPARVTSHPAASPAPGGVRGGSG